MFSFGVESFQVGCAIYLRLFVDHILINSGSVNMINALNSKHFLNAEVRKLGDRLGAVTFYSI